MCQLQWRPLSQHWPLVGATSSSGNRYLLLLLLAKFSCSLPALDERGRLRRARRPKRAAWPLEAAKFEHSAARYSCRLIVVVGAAVAVNDTSAANGCPIALTLSRTQTGF